MSRLTLIALSLLVSINASAQEPPHDHDHGPDDRHGHDHAGLHFHHPNVSESPLPETQFRIDYAYENLADAEGEVHAVGATFEYSPERWIAFELGVPYAFLNPEGGSHQERLDNVEVAVKLASFAFEEQGLLLGGGVEFILPTGNEERGIGSDHATEVEPFLGFGWKHDQWEVIGLVSFGIPVNENGEDESDLEIGWDLSLLYNLTDRVKPLVEFNGGEAIGGEEDGLGTVSITPGFHLIPFDDERLHIGIGVSLPLTSDREFHARPVFSVFYHF